MYKCQKPVLTVANGEKAGEKAPQQTDKKNSDSSTDLLKRNKNILSIC